MTSFTGERSPHIVVVEHAASIRSLYQELFQEERFRATILADCPATAAELARLAPDVIIHDYAPTNAEADLASLHRLTSDPATCHIPLILCSAALDVQDVAQQMEGVSVSVVRKPFIIDDLLATIECRMKPRLYLTRNDTPQQESSATT